MDDKVIINFLHIDCIRNYAIHKALYCQHENHGLTSNFWRVTSNTTRDFSIIQWCKLFGAWSESTHWKNHPYLNDFQTQILDVNGLSFQDWQNIHNEIVEYRDKNAAHIDINNWERNIPIMDTAINILCTSFDQFISSSYGGWNLRDEFDKVYKETLTASQTSDIK